jgi:hypothetical protein
MHPPKQENVELNKSYAYDAFQKYIVKVCVCYLARNSFHEVYEIRSIAKAFVVSCCESAFCRISFVSQLPVAYYSLFQVD